MSSAPTASTTVSAHVLLRLVDFCQRRGHDPEALCRSADLEYAWLKHGTARVPLPLVEQLCTRALWLVDDEQLGLHLAEDITNSAYYDLGVLMLMACPTLGDALRRLETITRFWGDGDRLEWIHRPKGIVIRSLLQGKSGDFVRHSHECALAEIALGTRALSGKPVHARLVRFAHGAPRTIGEHKRIFGCALQFDAQYSEIEFDNEALSTPMQSASDAFYGVFEKQMTHFLEQLSPLSSTSSAVRELVQATVTHGTLTLTEIARRLALSERSLQRRLRSEGVSFASIVDGVRREAAMTYLTRNLPLPEIASLLGYADVTAFHHAFRRWTGRSPADFRRGQQDCAGAPKR